MQNAKTGSFCLQITNWAKNCFGLANGRCCRTFNHLPHSKYVEIYFTTKKLMVVKILIDDFFIVDNLAIVIWQLRFSQKSHSITIAVSG